MGWEKLSGKAPEKSPGPVMFCFVNRYLEPMDSVKYRIEYDGKTISGVTTSERNTVEIAPLSLRPIKVYAWSRVRREFKLIDEVTPVLGRRLLINERMKTYKHTSETQLHPKPQLLPAPRKPKPATPAPPKRTSAPQEQPQGVEPVKARNERAEPEHQSNRPVTDTIQVIQLKKIFPAADEAYLGKVAAELNTDLVKYKLDTPLRRAHFFAQVRQEAGPTLSPKQENLNYLPAVLISKFSYYAEHPGEATQDGRLEEKKEIEKTVKNIKKKIKATKVVHPANQQAIANKAYGGRGNNGAASTGDGWKYRGRGIFQLTLRSNYNAFNDEYSGLWKSGDMNFVDAPDQVCEFPYFIRSAVWYWLKNKAYIKADGGADDASVNAITRIINGKAMDADAQRRKNFHELTYPAFK